MLITVSPAKRLDETEAVATGGTTPFFADDTATLAKTAVLKQPRKLEALMSVLTNIRPPEVTRAWAVVNALPDGSRPTLSHSELPTRRSASGSRPSRPRSVRSAAPAPIRSLPSASTSTTPRPS